ncbi:PREDICTED: pre-rRNA-processing protein ESF2-like [Acropora digitifera]|uniref:pre-rRNA-processing protein ESF2-like n=1 Tax=Acropora digitifera TaxID=70779 RepID=UPI00077AB90C|nr:PREDICTED: pre-rRNA-processing protein ESF2-like [Acropora digitifera]
MADDRATAPTNLIKKKSTTPGVVYLSRLPQSMNPTKIRRIFSMYGEVGRLFLQREGDAATKKRKKYGGSGRKRFTEGWIEYFFFFNFTFIFSLSVYEKVTRGERMRTEISQAKKEANFYAQNVEKGKVIEAKKRKGTYQV